MTAEPIISRGIRLPRPESLRLEHFSLYSREPDIEVVFNDGVSCLAGANGLGKSTFLAALNFAITGIVAEPDRRFGELSKWYKDSQPYSASFFKGRIRDEDRDLARITVVLRVGDRRYILSRSPFEPTALSALDITSDNADDVLQAAAKEDLSDAARHDLYAKAVTQDCGLDNFPQLVFLQHFILTFDEQRRLIFWDEDLARTAMYIVFGIDPRRAHRADTLVSKVSKADSRARNLQWQSSDLRRQLDNLTKTGAQAAEDEMSSEIDERHRELIAEQLEAGKVVERLAGELTDARLRIAQRSGELRSTRQEYDSLWQRRLHGHGHPKSHPLITTTIACNRCAVCGTEDGGVVESITQALNANRCPLCDSELSHRGGVAPEDTAARLTRVDADIVALQESIAATERVIGETSSQLEAARAHLERLSQELAEYASANELALARTTGASGGIDAVAERYKAQMADLQARKRTEIEHRNRDRAELTALQSELVGAYARAEQLFVPDFTELAQAFLGLDLSIEMQARSSGPNLMVAVQGSRRRASDALSESQRFFIDIALRMALATQMSSPGAPACLYIDTPEGSLDIAYEARAGSMFALFVERGLQLIMTANINTSQLLHRLAETLGAERMTLVRMTRWTTLSEVQAAEENLFESAFRQIEGTLEASA